MSVERMNNGFWIQREIKLRKLEVVWYNELADENQAHPDYSMGGELDGSLEKIVGNHLLLAGPLIDFYLTEIGTAFLEKLRRSHLTGAVPPVTTSMPIQIWDYLCTCLLYTSPSPRDRTRSRMPSSA